MSTVGHTAAPQAEAGETDLAAARQLIAAELGKSGLAEAVERTRELRAIYAEFGGSAEAMAAEIHFLRGLVRQEAKRVGLPPDLVLSPALRAGLG